MADGRLARRGALRLILGVTERGGLLNDLRADPAIERLRPEDRARAGRLAAEVLRWAERADRILAPHLSRRPPPAAEAALRLGTVELCTGGASHGVVNDIVALVGEDRRTARFKSLANAVLRKVAADGPGRWDALPVPRLPDWLRPPLVEAWGEAAIRGMEAAHAAGAPLDLTARDDPSALAEAVGGTLLPTGSVRLASGVRVSGLPGYEAGTFWVQDAAAALPARLLAPRPGERILDLCAAPGGKTLQLAAAGGDVTALDLSESRLGRLRENLGRTGLSARIVAADALEFDEGGWDAILLDAPCSATGTIRRHPDLTHARDGSGIDELIALQSRLLDHALDLLRPGGRLVFCTCSVIPDEGEVQADRVLAARAGLVAEPPEELPGLDPNWASVEGGLRIRPDHWADRGGIDGFYMVRLRRPA